MPKRNNGRSHVHGQRCSLPAILGRMNDQTPIPVDQAPARRRRISPEIARAVDLMVTEGLTQTKAAERVGIHNITLCKALKKPHIAALHEERKTLFAMDMDKLKGIARHLAIQQGVELMTTSPSHPVRARMVELFMGEARSPLVAVQVNNAPIASYHYPKPDAQSGEDAPQVIDAQVIKPESEE